MKDKTALYAMIINVAVCATVLTVAILLKEPWALAGLICMVSYKHKDLSIAAVDSYLLQRRNDTGPKAANRDIVELKALMNWAIRKNLWQSNLFRQVEKYPETKFSRYVPPSDDVALVRAEVYRLLTEQKENGNS